MKLRASDFTSSRGRASVPRRKTASDIDMWPGGLLVTMIDTPLASGPRHLSDFETMLDSDEICLAVASDITGAIDMTYVISAEKRLVGWSRARDLARGVFHKNSMLY